MQKPLAIVAGLAGLTLFDIAAAHAQPAALWNGLYAGGDIDLSRYSADIGTTSSFSLINGPIAFALSPQGALSGVHAGYNLLLPSGLLFGIEGSAAGGTISDSANQTGDLDGDGFTISASSRMDWQATLRARAGYAAGPWLLFAAGGVAWGGFSDSYSEVVSNVSPGDVYVLNGGAKTTRTGWTVGGGAELALGGGWSLRSEYFYSDFGAARTETVTPEAGSENNSPRTISFAQSGVQTVRFGVDYHF
jgi:outer membrane immunogenic protein